MQSFDDYCWVQNYQQTIPQSPFDSPHMPTPASHAISTPTISPTNAAAALFPKPTVGKSIRRRSRASKKAPTTLLNANANNFRALVQQFTGCHSAPPAFTSHSKGPINLNFAQYSEKYSSEAQRRQQEDQSFFGAAATSTTTTADDHEFFVSSTVNDNPRRDPLTFDDFDIDKISLQELSGVAAGEYCSGTRNDEFWGY